MNILKFILYKPYLLLLVYVATNFYLFSLNHTFSETISTIMLFMLNILIIAILFHYLKYSLVKLISNIGFFTKIPTKVLYGYLFIFTLFYPLPAIVLAVLSKLFIKEKASKTYIDDFGNEITQIKSLTPTVILSRKEQKTGEMEHIVVSKLKKKPRKVIYE